MKPRRPSTTQSLSEAELSVPVRLGRTRTLTITFPFACLVLEFDLAIPVASSGSSHVVALVEYDPWADELLLCVGEASCSRESKEAPFLLSPFPFKREGGLELR